MNRSEYYDHLSRVQNAPSIGNIIDIMTITGFMNDSEKLDHLEHYAAKTSDFRALEYIKVERPTI